VQSREGCALDRQPEPWHCRCPYLGNGGSPMLMFNRSQLYIGFALAALAEIIVRAVAR